MERIARKLTGYILHKGVIGEEEKDIYEFGFQSALELSVCFMFSVLIAAQFHMVIGGIIFFAIFIPLRSYAGGLHLAHFWSCFCLSTISFLTVLFAAKYLVLPDLIIFLLIVCFLSGIRLLYPVNHVNREVEPDEETFFKKWLNCFLVIDLAGTLFLFLLKQHYEMRVIGYTLFLVVVTMILGKIKEESIEQ